MYKINLDVKIWNNGGEKKKSIINRGMDEIF